MEETVDRADRDFVQFYSAGRTVLGSEFYLGKILPLVPFRKVDFEPEDLNKKQSSKEPRSFEANGK